MSGIAHPFWSLVLNEWRLRSRRISTLVVLALVIGISWLMVQDPQGGHALMVVKSQRMAYDSQALSFGASVLGSFLFGLVGFYLARGRSQEDLLHGTAQVLAATPVSKRLLLGTRWVGAVLFLLTLGAVEMATVAVLQALHGEAAVRLLPYVQMLLLGLLPILMLCASLAVLCDAWAPLMGRRGDLLYFSIWIGQFSLIPQYLDKEGRVLDGWLTLDFSGMVVMMHRFQTLTGTSNLSVGGGTFDPTLPVAHMPEGLWTPELVALRLGAMALSLLPLLPALWLFHRYDPDRVKARKARGGSRLWQRANGLLRPLGHWPAALLRLGSRWPGMPGQLMADVALSLLGQPLAVLGVLVIWGLSLLLPAAQLPGVMMVAMLCWGVLSSDAGSRHHQAATQALVGVVPGGPVRMALRQALAAWSLGLLMAAPVLLQWAVQRPMHALAALVGLGLASGLSALLGQLTRGSRSFLLLFLFWWYLGTQTPNVAWFNVLGFNPAVEGLKVAAFGLAGLACFLGVAGRARQG